MTNEECLKTADLKIKKNVDNALSSWETAR